MIHRVVLYGKPGCHLCEGIEQVLQDLHDEFEFSLEEIDITRDAGLNQVFREKIPVVVVDDRVTLTAPIRLAELSAALGAD